MIEIGNFYYFMELTLAILIFIFAYFFLKNKSKNFQYKFLLIWCFLNFALHFLKQLFYNSPDQFHKSTAENICAVSTICFPFIMLIKKDSPLHDFMYFIGLLGGIAGLLDPTEAIGHSYLEFETIRFYICHMSLLLIPLLLAILDIYRPRLKNLWVIPVFFLLYEFIIMVNTAILCFTEMVVREGFTPFELFIDRQYMNNSFVFGPTDDTGKLGEIIGSMALPFMKLDILNINNGNITYWPVLWLIIPSIVLFIPIYLIFAIPFNVNKSNKKGFS